MISNPRKLKHFSFIMNTALPSLLIVASRTISREEAAVQCQLVVVQVGLVEVEPASAVGLDFECVLVDDGAVVHGVCQALD